MSENPNQFITAITKIIAKSLFIQLQEVNRFLKDNAKQLAYLVVKGRNGDYTSIVQLYNSLGQYLITFFQSNPLPPSSTLTTFQEDDINILIIIVRPAFISQNQNVAQAGISLLKHLCLIFNSNPVSSNSSKIYQLLQKQQNSYGFVIMGLKRHPTLKTQIGQVSLLLLSNQGLSSYNQSNLEQFFISHMKKLLNNDNEYLKLVIHFLEGILKDQFDDGNIDRLQRQFKYTMINSDVLKFWEEDFLSIIGISSENRVINRSSKISYSLQTRLSYVELIEYLFIQFFDDVYSQATFLTGISLENLEKLLTKDQENQQSNIVNANPTLIESLLAELTSLERQPFYIVKTTSIRLIVSLLKFLADQKNSLAALIYRKVIFMFIQNFNDLEIRETLAYDLIDILRSYSKIPVNYLAEPLIKQLRILKENSQAETNLQKSTVVPKYKKIKKQDNSHPKITQTLSLLRMFDYELIMELVRHPKTTSEENYSFFEFLMESYIENMNVKGPVGEYSIDIYTEKTLQLLEVIIPRLKSPQGNQYKIYYSTILPFLERWLQSYESMLNVHISLSKDHVSKNSHKIPILAALTLKKMASTRCLNKIINIFIDWKYGSVKKQVNLEDSAFEDEEFLRIVKYMINFGYLRIDQELNYKDPQLQKILFLMKDIKIWKQISYPDIQNNSINKSLPPELTKEQNPYQSSPDQTINTISPRKKLHKILYSSPSPQITKILQEASLKYKEKKQHEHYNAKTQEVTQQYTLNEEEMLQRNIALGTKKLVVDLLGSKLFTNNSEQVMIFEFNSVKKSLIKNGINSIPLKEDQNREIQSLEIIYEKYQKYFDTLFRNYSTSTDTPKANKKSIISYSDVIRMLNRKGLLKGIPKILINEVIISINTKKSEKQRNVLAGIQQGDFLNFMICMVDVFVEHEQEKVFPKKTDSPLGIKLETLLLKLLQIDYEERGMFRELFDPRITDIKDKMIYHPNSLDQVTSDQKKQAKYKNSYQYEQAIQKIPIPEGYKKVKERQVLLNYKIRNRKVNVSESYLQCYEIVDQIFYEAFGTALMTGYVNYPTKYTIIPENVKPTYEDKIIPAVRHRSVEGVAQTPEGTQNKKNKQQVRHLSSKSLLTNKIDDGGSRQNEAKRSGSHKILPQIKKMKREQIPEEQAKKKKIRQMYNDQLKAKLEMMRSEKEQKILQQRQQEEKLRLKAKKKEEEDEKYRQNQKKIVEEYKMELKKSLLAEEENKVVDTYEQKQAIQAKLLQKQLKLIKKKKFAAQQRLNPQAKQELQIDFEQLIENEQKSKEERKKERILQKKLKEGQLAEMMNKYHPKFQILFENYWIWQQKKINLNRIALIVRDFILQQYITPHILTEVYNSISKGKTLDIEDFKELIAKVAYKSPKIQKQVTEIQGEAGNQEDIVNELSIKRLSLILHLLGMNKTKYKEYVVDVRKQSKKGTTLDI